MGSIPSRPSSFDRVAQCMRAPLSESGGRQFDSGRGHQCSVSSFSRALGLHPRGAGSKASTEHQVFGPSSSGEDARPISVSPEFESQRANQHRVTGVQRQHLWLPSRGNQFESDVTLQKHRAELRRGVCPYAVVIFSAHRRRPSAFLMDRFPAQPGTGQGRRSRPPGLP
jgi:hypothetical protein